MSIENANEQMQQAEDYESIVTSEGGGFEAAVIAASMEQAQQIIENAKAEGKKQYEEVLANDKADVVAAHKTELEAMLRRKVAGSRQDNMKKLLVYRKQLVNGLFAQCEEQLLAFTKEKKKEYAAFVLNSVKPYLTKIDKNSVLYIKQGDEDLATEYKTIMRGIETQVDKTIKIGGVKLKCNRVLFDETIDRRLVEEREEFLQRCNLHISIGETEPTDE